MTEDGEVAEGEGRGQAVPEGSAVGNVPHVWRREGTKGIDRRQ
jgi:hypothetical protein